MTDQLRYFRPKAGLQVRDPDGGVPLPPHGKGLAWSAYWQRRLDQGDIEPTDAKSVAAGDKKAAEPAKDGDA